MTAHVLELDLGNTRIKWRLWRNQLEFDVGACGYESDLHRVINDATNGSPIIECIKLASVVSAERLQTVLIQCESLCAKAPEIAKVQALCGGLTPAYQHLNNLGVDRWLALLATHHRYRSHCVVVGCGTAMTVDLLLSNGQHLGGYIVPGRELMREALFLRTGSVRLTELPIPTDLQPGNDTVPAVAKGIVVMLQSLVENAFDYLRAKTIELHSDASHNESIKIVMTGGDAPTILPFIKGEPVYNEHLVLDGLGIALP